MRAVVSGASGYLGSRLVSALAGLEDARVTGLVLEPDILAARIAEHEGDARLSFVASDDWDGTRAALRDADVLIHCAFPRAQAASFMAAGLDYTNDLFKAARDSGTAAVINISSQSVFDPNRTYAANEGSPLVLGSVYAAAKYATELMLEDVCGDMRHSSVRLSSLIGPGFNQRVVNKLVAASLAGQRLTIKGGNQTFDFMDVQDAVSALVTMAKTAGSEIEWERVYVLGSSHPCTLARMAGLVVNEVRRNGISAEEPEVIPNSDAIPNSSVDSSLFRESFGWEPAFSLENSIHEIAVALLQG